MHLRVFAGRFLARTARANWAADLGLEELQTPDGVINRLNTVDPTGIHFSMPCTTEAERGQMMMASVVCASL